MLNNVEKRASRGSSMIKAGLSLKFHCIPCYLENSVFDSETNLSTICTDMTTGPKKEFI